MGARITLVLKAIWMRRIFVAPVFLLAVKMLVFQNPAVGAQRSGRKLREVVPPIESLQQRQLSKALFWPISLLAYNSELLPEFFRLQPQGSVLNTVLPL